MLDKQTFDSNQKEERRTIPGTCNTVPAARENADSWDDRDTACEGQYLTRNSPLCQ